jgi:hypothetical protein
MTIVAFLSFPLLCSQNIYNKKRQRSTVPIKKGAVILLTLTYKLNPKNQTMQQGLRATTCAMRAYLAIHTVGFAHPNGLRTKINYTDIVPQYIDVVKSFHAIYRYFTKYALVISDCPLFE